jgi:hypothetical protein
MIQELTKEQLDSMWQPEGILKIEKYTTDPTIMRTINADKFIEGLDKAIKFHFENQDDPHGVGNAVIAALQEVKGALEISTREQTTLAPASTPALALTDKEKWNYMQALKAQRVARNQIEDCPGSPEQTEISTNASQAAFLLQAICMKFWMEINPITSQPYLASLGTESIPK